MLGGPADVVLSDMAANATGHARTDHLKIMALVEAAADFAREVLAPGGAFLAKVLQGGTEAALLAGLKRDFTKRQARQAAGQPRGFGRALPAGDRLSWLKQGATIALGISAFACYPPSPTQKRAVMWRGKSSQRASFKPRSPAGTSFWGRGSLGAARSWRWPRRTTQARARRSLSTTC